MFFLAESIDESRRKKALAGDMTPIEIDSTKQTGLFAGSEGNVYSTSLNECTCMDFAMNLGGTRPCKHMIRLAMEFGVLPNDGMINDQDVALSRYYYGILHAYIKTASLCEVAKVGQIIEIISETDTSPDDNALSFAGVPSLLKCGMFVIKGKKSKTFAIAKHARKNVESLRRSIIDRLGEAVYKHLDSKAVISFIESIDDKNPSIAFEHHNE